MITVAAIDKKASFKNLVIIPYVFVLFYYVLIASDIYTSEAVFTVKENGNPQAGIDLGLLSIGNTQGLEDERLMEEYLLSADMLSHLEAAIGHRTHYQDSGADWFSALSDDATREDYLEYFRDHVDVYFDDVSGLLHVEVKAFDDEYAQLMLKTMLSHAENVLNEFTHNLAMEQYHFVEKQLEKSQDSLKEAKQKLQAFQDKYQMFSPEQQGQSLTAIVDVLSAELSQEKARLKQLLGTQKPDSPQVVLVRERIRALTEQIRDEKERLVGGDGEGLNDLIARSTDLQLDLVFAKDAYASTLAALEQSRIEASKKIKHLVVISKPTLADEAKYPDLSYILTTVLAVLLMLFGIVRMSISTIKEHQD